MSGTVTDIVYRNHGYEVVIGVPGDWVDVCEYILTKFAADDPGQAARNLRDHPPALRKYK